METPERMTMHRLQRTAMVAQTETGERQAMALERIAAVLELIALHMGAMPSEAKEPYGKEPA